jgi:hypothetical protein
VIQDLGTSRDAVAGSTEAVDARVTPADTDARGESAGIICRAPTPKVDIPGALKHYGSLPLPPDCERVVEPGDPEAHRAALETVYRHAAERLVARGAKFVTTDCGWNVDLHGAVQAGSSGVPALSSILQFLPFLLAVFPVVGIVSIRPARLRHVLPDCRLDPASPAIRIAGVDEDGPWRAEGEPDLKALEQELIDVALRLTGQEQVDALLLDCTSFAAFAASIQARSGVPTFGLTGLLHYLMGSGIR